jgi:hydroxymethylbilane synthase
VPIGALSTVEGDFLTLRGVVLSPDGSRKVVDTHRGPIEQPLNVGSELAARLLTAGARELLQPSG